MIPCLQCGTFFYEQPARHQRYCSHKCANVATAHKRLTWRRNFHNGPDYMPKLTPIENIMRHIRGDRLTERDLIRLGKRALRGDIVPVIVHGGDYRYKGWLAGLAYKPPHRRSKAGVWRAVVRCRDRRLFIHNAGSVEPVRPPRYVAEPVNRKPRGRKRS